MDQVYDIRAVNDTQWHIEIKVEISGENFKSSRGPVVNTVIPAGEHAAITSVSSDDASRAWNWTRTWTWNSQSPSDLGVPGPDGPQCMRHFVDFTIGAVGDSQIHSAWGYFLRGDSSHNGVLSRREVRLPDSYAAK